MKLFTPLKYLTILLVCMLTISIVAANPLISRLQVSRTQQIAVMSSESSSRTHLTPESHNVFTIFKTAEYNLNYRTVEFRGDGHFSMYPYRVTELEDVYHLDFPYELEQVKTRISELHAMGMKFIIYKPFSSLSEWNNFMAYYNLSIEDIAPMDLNGTYYVDIPYRLGYEGRDTWRTFFIEYMKFLFDAGIDGVEFDGGDGLKNIGSFDSETMHKFNEYLASKYNSTELESKFNITDINTFNFTQYLRDLGYHHHALIISDTLTIAHPGIEGPQDNECAKALWKEFQNFNLKMILELYELLYENVKKWEEETGRTFYISTRFGHQHFNPGAGTEENDLFVLQYVDGMNWEFTWFSTPGAGGNSDIIGYPNRTASTVFRILQGLNKSFAPWITPASSLESTGFTAWFTNGWNNSADPEEQYLALAEMVVCGGRVLSGTNITHTAQFLEFIQHNLHLFGHAQFSEIALIYPVATATHIEDLNMTSVFGDSFDGYEGAYYLLADSHRTFDIIVFGDNIWVNMTPTLSKLLQYKAIILSDAVCLTDDQVELLKNYLENGGTIIGIGEVATYNEYGEEVNREFANLFDGGVHQYGNGLIVSITNVSPSDYLLLRTQYNASANSILETFENILDTYVPREIETDLSTRAHIYRFFNYDENDLIFHIINFDYDFQADKVVRAHDVKFNFKLPSQLDGQQLSVWIYSEDYPDGIEVPFSINNSWVSITIPKVSILTSIEVRPHFDYTEPLIINEPTVISEETFVLNRSLIINSSLEIIDSQVVVQGGIKPVAIEVLPSGSLTIVNSKIYKESGNYYILAKENSHIFINSSEIVGAGMLGSLDMGGISIETQDAVIVNSKISDNYDYGLLLVEASFAVISNNVFTNCRIGAIFANSSYVIFHNNIVDNNDVGVCIRGGTSLDIYDIGTRFRTLIKLYFNLRQVPDRGSTKIDISQCNISNNSLFNIIAIDASFVTITGCTLSNAAVANIFAFRSIVKIHNSTIHTSQIGIYLESCPIITLLSNKIYNHSYIGIKAYHIIYMGILRWLHLEPIAELITLPAVILGNQIFNNTYGIHINSDADWNEYFRIANNTIENNEVGMYINNTKAYIYQNNFINNTIQAKCGKCPPTFYLISYTSKFKGNETGNYWSDYHGSDSYLVTNCSGTLIYDLYPLDTPADVPLIQDITGPIVRIINFTVSENETAGTSLVNVSFYAWDENYLASTNWKENLGVLSIINLLGPYISIENGEYGWNGYSEEDCGPDEVDYGPPIGWDSWINNSITLVHTFTPLPSTWLMQSTVTVYCSDMYGNWGMNDTISPHVAVVYKTPKIVYSSNKTLIYVAVFDWSRISKVQLYYTNGSSWFVIDMHYDNLTHLYYGTIPPNQGGTTIKYKIFAEDVLGNSYTSAEYSYTISPLEQQQPEEETPSTQEQPTSEEETPTQYIWDLLRGPTVYIGIVAVAVVVSLFVARKLRSHR